MGAVTFPLFYCHAGKKWQFGGLSGDARESRAEVAEGGFPLISTREYMIFSKVNNSITRDLSVCMYVRLFVSLTLDQGCVFLRKLRECTVSEASRVLQTKRVSEIRAKRGCVWRAKRV